MTHARRRRAHHGQQGSALVLALFVIVILTFMGLGLMLQTSVSSAGAGAERAITKGFYAADSGIHMGFARLQLNNPCAFQVNGTVEDSRGGLLSTPSVSLPITIDVEESVLIGDPQFVQGSEVGGGIAGGGVSIVYLAYRMNSTSAEAATQTRRAIEADVSLGPMPRLIPQPCGTPNTTSLATPVPGP